MSLVAVPTTIYSVLVIIRGYGVGFDEFIIIRKIKNITRISTSIAMIINNLSVISENYINFRKCPSYKSSRKLKPV
ncbi:hypothetical protein J8J42_02405 [Chryseobacterium sp. cx-311]|uniref:hypothetical protein n=1 Tax=Marnyiella aurantia TaxID=2758037 RepID=UPI001AEB3417|nr:hypothetical protein [Marnyiella aurantia]MBP0611895.1 hypothetical protein [Marnyiella aurantia]